jgi:hypothetical protein
MLIFFTLWLDKKMVQYRLHNIRYENKYSYKASFLGFDCYKKLIQSDFI